MNSRRALITLNPEQLEQLLDLPDGYEVAYIGGDFLRQAVVIGVQSDDLQSVTPGAEPPALGGAFSQHQVIVDGKIYFRWAWTPETPE